MAKTIKFNLICDETPVRTIEELQDHFSVEDILEYYQNGLLLRWLSVRGYTEEFQQVSQITETDHKEIMRKLVKIFEIDHDAQEIEEALRIVQYQNNQKQAYAAYEQQQHNIDGLIETYHQGYQLLISGIIDHPKDLELITKNIWRIATQYAQLFKLDYYRLFRIFYKNSKLAVMCLLMDPKTRPYYMDPPEDPLLNSLYNEIKADLTKMISSDECLNNLCQELGDQLHLYTGNTNDQWKNIVPRGKKVLIIWYSARGYRRTGVYNPFEQIFMTDSNCIKPAGSPDESSSQAKYPFSIINGLDYKSNSNMTRVLYMEV